MRWSVERETIELAFLAALQVLPPRQRAALLVRDVLGWPAMETASLLETSVAAANSALQRARATLQAHLPPRRSDWSAGAPSDEERALLGQFIDAHERCDAAAAIALAAQDIRISMPPDALCFDGREMVAPLIERAFGPQRDGDWRLRADSRESHADCRQLPAAARRQPVPSIQARRAADRKRRHQGDHDLRQSVVPGLRTATHPPTIDGYRITPRSDDGADPRAIA